MKLDSKIEAVLFFKAEPVSVKRLSEIFGVFESEILEALKELESKLAGRGLRLVWKEEEVMLGTAPECSEVIEKITKEELIRDLGKAGLETLSIVIYKGPVSRKEIDYIRGVNSNFILRNLLVRGLVEKNASEKDQRQFLYKPTFELLSHLGVGKIEDVPEYDVLKAAMKSSAEELPKKEPPEAAELTEEEVVEEVQAPEMPLDEKNG